MVKLGKFNTRLLLKRCDIIIFFCDRKYLLDEVIPQHAKVGLIEPYRDIFINPIIMMKTFWYFFVTSIKYGNKSQTKITTLIALAYDEHLRIALSIYEPKLVISMIHDSSIFHRIAEK